ncbi:MAG: ribonuclease J [Deltaproteobacteria bacterium]|nr:ribonuclease J [Deltaproteobacteria bacterium]
MMVLECRDKLLLIDCGLMFPESSMLGIDFAIPDVTCLADRTADIVGLFLTHGHEDHIGAVPFLLERLGFPPIFGSPLTLGLLQSKLDEHDLNRTPEIHTISPAGSVHLAPFEVEFFRVSHSIVDGVGLAIRTPAGLVVHTGDFKLDPDPLDGEKTDTDRLARYGNEGVLLLLSDSTNVESPGRTPSESGVGKMFDSILPQCRGWVMVAAFASNIHRVQQAINAALKTGRKIVITGRSMLLVSRVARQLGYLHIPDDALIDLDELKYHPRDKAMIITTGSQGEFRSALSRVAMGEHKQLQLEDGDVVILSSKFIPGNERSIQQTINNLYRRGAEVYYETTSDVHVSGHASREELREVLNLVRPRYFVPVHGEYRHLVKHTQLAQDTGVARENTFILENGEALRVSAQGCAIEECVHSGRTLVHGKGVGDLGLDEIRDRRHLGHHGLVVVQFSYEAATGRLLDEPKFHTRGFMAEEDEELLDRAREVIRQVLDEQCPGLTGDREILADELRRKLQRFFSRTLERRPLVVPLIQDV